MSEALYSLHFPEVIQENGDRIWGSQLFCSWEALEKAAKSSPDLEGLEVSKHASGGEALFRVPYTHLVFCREVQSEVDRINGTPGQVTVSVQQDEDGFFILIDRHALGALCMHPRDFLAWARWQDDPKPAEGRYVWEVPDLKPTSIDGIRQALNLPGNRAHRRSKKRGKT